jgi:glycosyltransferase involved in cell wall biosynthesis
MDIMLRGNFSLGNEFFTTLLSSYSSIIMRTPKTIDVLLATYNEGKYINQFFESLINQTNQNWRILARDDKSSDSTNDLLNLWHARLGDRMVLLPDSGQVNLGVAGNFTKLLSASSSPYAMLANPDDVWHPEKISITFNGMQSAEYKVGKSTPCLVHTDLRIVNIHLECIAESLWVYQGLRATKKPSLTGTFIENKVWACTTMINRALIELAGAIPYESHHEDWWLAMVAAAFGHTTSIPIPTIDWRRHGQNDSDISNLNSAVRSAILAPIKTRERLHKLLTDTQPRVRVFLERFRPLMSPRQIAAAEAYINLTNIDFVTRRVAIIQHRLYFSSWQRNAGLFLFL